MRESREIGTGQTMVPKGTESRESDEADRDSGCFLSKGHIYFLAHETERRLLPGGRGGLGVTVREEGRGFEAPRHVLLAPFFPGQCQVPSAEEFLGKSSATSKRHRILL